MIAHAAGVVVAVLEILRLVLGAVVAVVEAHDVAVGSAQAGMLLVLPVEVVAHGLEEVLLVFGGPVLGIADDPVQLAGLIVEVDDGVFVAAGNGDGLILLEVPDSVAVKPVAGAL